MKPLAIAVVLALWSASAGAQTVTELLRSGANGSKRNLVIIGDGFTAANQNGYNTFVTNTVIRGVFNESITGTDDFYPIAMNAFNIFRVNANSQQSGITTVDSNGMVTNAVNTFLGFRYSGIWGRCWMEPGPNSNTTLNNTLNQLVPGWDYAFIILNTTSGGGCRRGNTLAITMGSGATTAMHEMGHMVGNLGDEYTGTANFTGTDPGIINMTTATTRATLKWNTFVNPSTPIPTNAGTFTGSTSDDAGLFAGATFGGTRYASGISRPAVNCRMNGNAPPFCPICYNQMEESVDSRHEFVYRDVYTGHFKKGNTDSVMIHNANSIALYNGINDEIDPAWARTLPDAVWDAYVPETASTLATSMETAFTTSLSSTSRTGRCPTSRCCEERAPDSKACAASIATCPAGARCARTTNSSSATSMAITRRTLRSSTDRTGTSRICWSCTPRATT